MAFQCLTSLIPSHLFSLFSLITCVELEDIIVYVLKLSPSDADIVASHTTRMDEAKQEARKMNMAVLAVSS